MNAERGRYGLHDVELSEPLSPITPGPEEAGVALVLRYKGRAIGFHMARRARAIKWIDAEIYQRDVGIASGEALLACKIEQELIDQTPGIETAQYRSLTICVCTHNRPERLARLLETFETLIVPDSFNVELLVVDNASPDDASRDFVQSLIDSGGPHPSIALRYVFEPKAGLNFARNRALAEARGEWLAFVDDDVVIDRFYLVGLAEGWAQHPDAAALTGQVLPMALDTAAQVAFERADGFRKGFAEQRYHGPTHPGNPLHPCGSGAMGVGANMAFEVETLNKIGGFDDALDTGRPLPGGGDLDIFLRVVDAGKPLVYWPRMVVLHEHRRELPSLRYQYVTWGRSVMALAEKHIRFNPKLRTKMKRLRRWYLLHTLRIALRSLVGLEPRSFQNSFAEFRGAVIGLFGEYRRSRSRTEAIRRRVEGQSATPKPPPICGEQGETPVFDKDSPWRVEHHCLTAQASSLALNAGEAGCFVVWWLADTPCGQSWVPRRKGGVPAAWMIAQAAFKSASAIGARLWPENFREPLPMPDFLSRSNKRAPEIDAINACNQPLAKACGSKVNAPRDEAIYTAADISVVVCTCRRPDDLAQCLPALLKLDPAPHEILVVDNGPDDPTTREVVERFPGIRYGQEPRPGLAHARNTGIRQTTGSIVAFTDDDALVHPGWISAITRAFDSEQVGCVTGLVSPAVLDTAAQVWFEGGVGNQKWSYRPQRFNKAYYNEMRWWGVPAWMIGAGANMALSRKACHAAGLNDTRLGPPYQGCGEDSEHWHRILRHGFDCVYEPRSVVHHHHRRDEAGLDRQMFSYIRGHIAALWVQLSRSGHPGDLLGIVARLPWHLWSILLQRLLYGPEPPRRIRAQIKGYFRGLLDVIIIVRSSRAMRLQDEDQSTDVIAGSRR